MLVGQEIFCQFPSICFRGHFRLKLADDLNLKFFLFIMGLLHQLILDKRGCCYAIRPICRLLLWIVMRVNV
ncbi:hypothetical protein H261_21079 [Paramagnetospirillum caucaseum]|uniref:Uncharacterized protein n=1 Tax=Paramagnetospirillum caucaseum TaxID=1244869 RepID=M2Y4B9_9PROT|nr:hypothetical protein H261_21079 [Paramagnetospirillum caucaseum]